MKELVIKSINKMLSLEEEIVLKDWINRSDENRILYNKWQSLYMLDAMQYEYNSIRRKQLLDNMIYLIKKDKKRRIIRKWLVSASVAAAVVAFALFIIRNTANENSLLNLENSIAENENVVIDTIFNADQIIAYVSQRRDPIDPYACSLTEIEKGKQVPFKATENIIIVPEKKIYNIMLNDSTKVQINGGSRLIYPSAFGDSIREVELVGEAFFEVVADSSRPFIVKTKDVKSIVYGTKINVEAYSNSNYTATTLFSGKVSVNGVKIAPGKRAVKYENSEKVNVCDVDLRKIDSWRRNEFYYYQTRLGEIMKNLSQWYNVEIYFDDESIETELFTLIYLRNKSLTEVLDLLSSTNKVKFKKIGNEIYVEKLK